MESTPHNARHQRFEVSWFYPEGLGPDAGISDGKGSKKARKPHHPRDLKHALHSLRADTDSICWLCFAIR